MGSFVRCASCRRDSRVAAAAVCLAQALGLQGSAARRELLFVGLPQAELRAKLQRGLVCRGRRPPPGFVRQAASAAGVPTLQADGLLSWPADYAQVVSQLESHGSPVASDQLPCKSCGAILGLPECLSQMLHRLLQRVRLPWPR